MSNQNITITQHITSNGNKTHVESCIVAEWNLIWTRLYNNSVCRRIACCSQKPCNQSQWWCRHSKGVLWSSNSTLNPSYPFTLHIADTHVVLRLSSVLNFVAQVVRATKRNEIESKSFFPCVHSICHKHMHYTHTHTSLPWNGRDSELLRFCTETVPFFVRRAKSVTGTGVFLRFPLAGARCRIFDRRTEKFKLKYFAAY